MTISEQADCLERIAYNTMAGECELPSHDEACEAFTAGISALREKADRLNPKPLTLEELRGMTGDMAWCEDTDGINPVLLCLRNHLLKDGKGVYAWALDHEGDVGVYDAECMMDCGARFYRTKPEGSAE